MQKNTQTSAQKKVFIIGIGGKGLNGIAKICLEKGYNVAGVDQMEKPETVALENSGAKIYYGHDQNNLASDTDIVVYSSIAKDAPEVQKATHLGITLQKRSEFLNFLTKDNFRICVAGSHGKSTTTALLGLSTVNSGIDATIFGGAYTKELNGYNHFGKSKYSIIEACEYDRSFYDLIGNYTIVTSVEKSHMEYYRDEDDMLDAFHHFLGQHKPEAKIFINGDSYVSRKITENIQAEVITFGFSPRNDYFITDITKDNFGSTFSLFHLGEKLVGDLRINIPGDYNILNYASTIAVTNELNFPMDGIYKTARIFTGVGRRFEVSENKQGQILVDDFAHHPSQVKYLFDGIKQFFPKQKICAIFQPRQFNLMKNFIKEYGESFQDADEIILTDILPALGDTEADIQSINTAELAKSIQNRSSKPVRMINTFPEIVEYVKSHYQQNSVITTIGAGDIYKVRDELMQ